MQLARSSCPYYNYTNRRQPGARRGSAGNQTIYNTNLRASSAQGQERDGLAISGSRPERFDAAFTTKSVNHPGAAPKSHLIPAALSLPQCSLCGVGIVTRCYDADWIPKVVRKHFWKVTLPGAPTNDCDRTR